MRKKAQQFQLTAEVKSASYFELIRGDLALLGVEDVGHALLQASQTHRPF